MKPSILSKFNSFLKRSKYLVNIGWLIRGNVIGQLIQLASVPILSRLYSPEEFGLFTLFIAFIGFSVIVLSLKLESAILVVEDEEVEDVRHLAFILVLANSTILTAIFYMLCELNFLQFNVTVSWIAPFILITLMGHGFFNIERAIALRNGHAPSISKARVEKSLSNAFVKIASGLYSLGFWGLALGEVISSWMAFRRVSGNLKNVFINNTIKVKRSISLVLSKYRKFPLIEAPSSLLDQAALVLPIPMIAFIGGVESAGAYGMARMIVAVPNIQLGRAVADGFQWKVSEHFRKNNIDKVVKLTRQTFLYLALFGIFPYLLIYLLSPSLFPLLLGDNWLEAGEIASALSVWMFFAFTVAPISRLLSVLKKQEYKLYYDVFVLVSLIAGYQCSIFYKLSTLNFIWIVVALNSIGYLIYLCLIFLASKSLVSKENK